MAFDEVVGNTKGWSKATNGMVSSLNALAGDSDGLSFVTEKIAPALSLCASAMELGLGLQKAIDSRKVITETAKATALTSLRALTPWGWGMIAGATAIGATVGVAVAKWQKGTAISSGFSSRIQANLSNASERTAISQLVGSLQ